MPIHQASLPKLDMDVLTVKHMFNQKMGHILLTCKLSCGTTLQQEAAMQMASAHAGALCALSMPLRLCRP